MTEFTPIGALLGGLLLGLGALLLLWLNGNIAGISGIVGNLLKPAVKDNVWRLAFILGLIIGPIISKLWDVGLPRTIDLSWPAVLVGGLLVGLGSQVGSGCTSGHGICGIGRLSPRSVTATLIFMLVAVVTVFVMRHVLGGVL